MSTSAKQSDDKIPTDYPYSWSPSSTLSIEEFVAKYKPSMVQNDGTKPWLWVRRDDKEAKEEIPIEMEAAAVVEAAAICEEVSHVTVRVAEGFVVKGVTERVEEIQNDSSIPVRASKKAGTRSKKEVREQVQAEAAEKLKEISQKYGYVSGKWLIFAPSDKVDAIWSKIASSLASGPLSSTSASCAKVATSPENDVSSYQHVICVYIPDVYDKDDVTKVMKVLLRQHGVNLSGVKSNLYTMIGVDSKHPSGISSTIWKNVALMKDSEIKELKEAYFAELSAAKTAAAEVTKETKAAEGKAKPALKKKKVEDDPFASDGEYESSNEKGKGKKRGVEESEDDGKMAKRKRKI